MKKHLIDIAYELALKKFKKNSFSFRELFKLVVEKNPEYKSRVGDLYVDIINDIRFLSIGKDKWSLTENHKYEDVQKISSSMFGLDKYSLEDDLDDDLKELLLDAQNQKEEEFDVELDDLDDYDERTSKSIDYRNTSNKDDDEFDTSIDDDFEEEIDDLDEEEDSSINYDDEDLTYDDKDDDFDE